MLLFCIIYLFITFFLCWTSLWSLGYFGVFYLIFVCLFICFIISWWAIYYSWLFGNIVEFNNFIWVELGNNCYIFWNLRFDFFGVLISFVVISASLIVLIFSFFDMWDDKEGSNFLIILGFFASFMLVVINSGNLMLFYLGWEGIGLTSLFLVNFWSERVRSLKASIKVFVINKIGDFFFLLLLCCFLTFCGDLDFAILNCFSPLYLHYTFSFIFLKIYLVDILGVLLFFSGCVKSAQYGFHIWLLEAMEAPLGASALMHSSTLVISGLILYFRLSIIVEMSVFTQYLMFFFSIMSAFIGSFLAMFQFELKVIMAYSTISNMGYMLSLFSLGAYKETMIVMILHAYIKIYMFLIVGSIMLHCNGNQDLRWMGNLFSYIPTMWVSYFIGSLALAGIPFLSGYYYKFYLWQIITDSNLLLFGGEYLIFLSFIFTLIYLFRAGYLIFLGPKNGHRSIYKNKNFSSFFILNLFLLIFFIFFSSLFFICLLETNLSSISTSFYFLSRLYFNCFFFISSEYSLYLWVCVYLIIFLVCYFWYVFSLNFEWNFLKYWFLSFTFFFFLFVLIFFNF